MLVQWIIIAIIIAIGIWYIKMEHHSRKVAIIVMVIIGAMLYFSLMGIFKSEQVDTSSPKGIVNAVYVYFGWIGQTISSLWDIGTDTVALVGNAIKVNNTEDKPRR